MAELIYRKGHRTSLPTQNGQSGVRDGKRDGKKDADLKVHFRLGKEMSAKEWMALGGVSAEAVEGVGSGVGSGPGSVDNFLSGAL